MSVCISCSGSCSGAAQAAHSSIAIASSPIAARFQNPFMTRSPPLALTVLFYDTTCPQKPRVTAG